MYDAFHATGAGSAFGLVTTPGQKSSIEDFRVTAYSGPVVAEGFKSSIEDFRVIAYSGPVAAEGSKSSIGHFRVTPYSVPGIAKGTHSSIEHFRVTAYSGLVPTPGEKSSIERFRVSAYSGLVIAKMPHIEHPTLPFQLWRLVAPPGRFPFHANQVTGSAGRAGRFSCGAGTLVSNSFLFLREAAGREWHGSAP